MVSDFYRHSLALLTDLYELTMAYGYWKLGRADDEAVFHLFFREHAFGGGYCITAGLGYVVDFLGRLKFEDVDLEYLSRLTGNDGERLFEPAFLEYLGDLAFSCDVDGIPEGTVVFSQQPLLRVKGKILQCQILETALLNMLNFQTLVATKASRICAAARGDPVLEFGLRRAQGIDGALAASRAAYIGGCAATSNVLAGKLFGIPIRGTHAHSWVMSFEDEFEAFDAYAQVLPNNCVFLVDTYDTLEGVKRAVEVGQRLHQRGFDMAGIRLDSGDLAEISIEARRLLDEGGFEKAAIVASNDLDEHIIDRLKSRGATIAVWGVGTRLVTAYDQPALGGVYKLTAVRRPGQDWQYKVKLSEQVAKGSTPGMLQVRRYRDQSGMVADMIYDEWLGVGEQATMVDPTNPAQRKVFSPEAAYEDLLIPVVRQGKLIYESPPLDGIRSRAQDQLASLHPHVRRFTKPRTYPVGLEKDLYDLKTRLIQKASGLAGEGGQSR